MDCASKLASIAAIVSARRLGSIASSAAAMDAGVEGRRSGTSDLSCATGCTGGCGGTGARMASSTSSGTPCASSTGNESRTDGELVTPSLAKVVRCALPPASTTVLRNSPKVEAAVAVNGTNAMTVQSSRRRRGVPRARAEKAAEHQGKRRRRRRPTKRERATDGDTRRDRRG